MFAETALVLCQYIVRLKTPDQAFVDHAFDCLAYAAGYNWSVVVAVVVAGR